MLPDNGQALTVTWAMVTLGMVWGVQATVPPIFAADLETIKARGYVVVGRFFFVFQNTRSGFSLNCENDYGLLFNSKILLCSAEILILTMMVPFYVDTI